jgi:hypothetical protein
MPTVTPAPSECSYAVGDAPAGDVAAPGGQFDVTITTSAGCAWTASSSSAFIATVGAASGSGSGTMRFAVAPNSDAARQGTVQVANRALTISQAAGAAVGCAFSIDPAQASVTSAGGAVFVTITRTSGANCSWISTSNDPFITIQSGAGGTDNGTTLLAVAANSGPARTGSAFIAGRLLTITQTAPSSHCAFAVTPTAVPVPAAGGSAQVAITITNGTNCAWTAQSSATFITIANASGMGSATVSFTVAANTGASRSGTLTIAGETVTVNQSGSGTSTGPVAMLSYQSEPGDYIGQGLSDTFTLNASQFQVQLNASQSELRFSVPPSGGTWWSLTLKSAGGTLAPGTYNQAARAPFAPAGAPGLDFSGSGRGCNRLTGRFLVQTAVFSGTDVQRFHARFEQHCEGGSTPLRGQIWIDAAGGAPPSLADFAAPAATPITQVAYTSEPGDFIGGGTSGSFTLAGLKFIAWAHSSRPAVEIRLQSASGLPTTNWSFDFSAASGTRLQPGTYTGATRYPFNSGVPGLSVSGNSTACGTVIGSFVVLEALYGPQGEVLRFHATFEQRCDGAAAALRGEVRILADPWR